ncbi:pinin/SDK/memA/ protein conserved region-domain-containing protein [Dichotomocladium elegans]|nr:pinin/SDK/memA/ protein conserved region-domain-containing protein [Dichotomocladium elegans]
MVKSSIIVPPQSVGSSSRKRSMDPDSEASVTKATEESTAEVKKPRVEMNADSKRRGQRLFGVLIGTLNKFKDESKNQSEAEKKRHEIDTKLHEKLATEKKELAEKIQADRERRDQEMELTKRRELRLAEEKRDATNVQQNENLAKFLKTKTSPILCFRPSKMTEEQEQEIESQKKKAEEDRKMYEERREIRMQKEEEDAKGAPESATRRDEKDRSEEHDNQSAGSPHLESPALEDSVVADRDEAAA